MFTTSRRFRGNPRATLARRPADGIASQLMRGSPLKMKPQMSNLKNDSFMDYYNDKDRMQFEDEEP